MDGNGWADIAYTSGACPHGVRYEGRGPGRRTAAQGTTAGNDRSYAVCYIAGGNDPLTDEARAAFADEGARLKPLRWGHQDWKSTACPGTDLWAWRRAGFPYDDGSTTTPPGGDDDMTPEERQMLDQIHGWMADAVGRGQTDFPGTVRKGHSLDIEIVRKIRQVPTGDQLGLRVIAAVQWVLDDRGITGDGTGGEAPDWEEIARFIADATREAVRDELPLVLDELDVELPADLEAVVNEGLARRILGESEA